ncbi:hypothetical protein [Streptomyces sp. NPDC058434]|uniref:hypothetical protein n=1 Tax=Streptomyces sp. NPDC058434 TaxID=3346498 RepID=UPI00365787A4
MGWISIDGSRPDRLLAGGTGGYDLLYQQAYAELAATHRGRPVGEVLPELRLAAYAALLGFTESDLVEQSRAISTGAPYELRVRVT